MKFPAPFLPLLIAILLAAGPLPASAAAAPPAATVDESFDGAPPGPGSPSGWTAQPSTTGVWQVASAPGFGRVWRLSGTSFDRNGNASATRRIELVASRPWRLSSDFSLREFAAASKAGLARFGLGALGQRPLFASADGTDAAKYSFYLVDVRVSANDKPDSLTPVLRIVRFDDRGIPAVLAAETQFSRMPLAPGDRLRLVVNGAYNAGGALTLEARLINLTQSTTTPALTGVDGTPLSGAHFGYRHSEGRTGLTACELWNDNFSLSLQP